MPFKYGIKLQAHGICHEPDLIIRYICLYNDILKNFYIATILNYELFFKYEYISTENTTHKNNIKNTDDKSERNDLLKSLGGLAIIVLAFILLVYITINSNVIIGFIVFAFLIWLGYTIINSISDKTKREVAEINKQKEYQELHGGYKCPNCGECAGHEISTVKKAVSVGMLGLASDKIGKNYECKNCGYKW